MKNRIEDLAGFESMEEFSDEFQCCVCLDLLYKPVVLACGHMSCFWCLVRAMDSWRESSCIMRRHPYNHFPRVCQLLHFLLLRLYPIAYKRRENQVLEEEKRLEMSSAHFDTCSSGSQPSVELDVLRGIPGHLTTGSCSENSLRSCSAVEGEHFIIKDSLKSSILPHKDDATSIFGKPTFDASETEQDHTLGDNFSKSQNSKQLLVADFLCAICKDLLYRPVVLNCGHVHCEACIMGCSLNVQICPICQSAHQNGYPKVCLVLEHFLEEQFSEQYALRKEALSKQANNQKESPAFQSKPRKNDAKFLSGSTDDYLSCWSDRGTKVHYGVGCDHCGMYPIMGERYRCKDCKERVGFDLCRGCYNCSSKLPGRFNQQHRPEHRFEVVHFRVTTCILLRPEDEEFEDDDNDDDASEDPQMEVVPSANSLFADASDNQEDGFAAIMSNTSSEDENSSNSTLNHGQVL